MDMWTISDDQIRERAERLSPGCVVLALLPIITGFRREIEIRTASGALEVVTVRP